jgi:hypothetical protein
MAKRVPADIAYTQLFATGLMDSLMIAIGQYGCLPRFAPARRESLAILCTNSVCKDGKRRIQTSNDNERLVAESSLFSSAHLAMACAYSFGSFFTNHKSVRLHQTAKET